VAPPESPPAGERLPVAVVSEGGALRDDRGRLVHLHGVNARVEGLFDVTFDDGRVALETIPPFGREDCRILGEDLGLSLLRLPVNWSGVEPQPGEFDAAYLDQVRTLVEACAEHGVTTLVDLHQDAYSKEIGEDGAPLWAIVPPPSQLLEGPLVDLSERRQSQDVLAAFGSFFDDAPALDGRPLQDAYAGAAVALLESLDGAPGFLGIELMNEPVSFDHERLDAFHRRVRDALRAVSPSLPLAFEPDALRNFLDTDPVHFPWAEDGGIYAPHHYTKVFTSPGEEVLDPGLQRDSAVGMAAEGALHGSPVLVGEFGRDPRTEAGIQWIGDALDLYDELGFSWAFWVYEEHEQGQWGLWDTDSGERAAMREPLAELLARPRPLALSAEGAAWSWDGVSLRIELDAAGDEPHLVSWSDRWGEPAVRCAGETVAATHSLGRLTFLCGEGAIEVRGERAASP
jgi:endoglycosylceramidase